jgi:hypothetical protein
MSMLQVICPNPQCKTRCDVPDSLVNQKVACSVCQTAFVVRPPVKKPTTGVTNPPTTGLPKPATPTSPDMPPPDAGPDATPAVTDAPPAPTGTRAPRRTTGVSAGVRDVTARRVAAGGIGWLSVTAALLALVLPSGAGALFYFTRPPSPAAAPEKVDEPGQLYGGIEIGSSSVKTTVVEMIPHKDLGVDYRIVSRKSHETNLVKGMDKRDYFDPAAYEDTVNTIRGFYEQLGKDHKIPPEHIHIVGGSGLFKILRERKDLTEEARDELIRKNRALLTKAVLRVTDRPLDCIDVFQEVGFQVTGLIPDRYAPVAALIDIGTSSTRGGYRADAGILEKFEAPGVGKVEAALQRLQVRPTDIPDLEPMLQTEFRDPLKAGLTRRAELYSRKRIYLNGGAAWVIATLLHPGDRQVFVRLEGKDFKDLCALLRRSGDRFPEVAVPDNLDADVRKEAEAQLTKVSKVYRDPLRRLAAAEVLRCLADELKFADKDVFFVREGEIGWLLTYIREKNLSGH